MITRCESFVSRSLNVRPRNSGTLSVVLMVIPETIIVFGLVIAIQLLNAVVK